MFRENVDRGQNVAYSVLVEALVERGAITVEDLTSRLKAAEEEARRMNEHAGTIRQLHNLRTRIERLGGSGSRSSTG